MPSAFALAIPSSWRSRRLAFFTSGELAQHLQASTALKREFHAVTYASAEDRFLALPARSKGRS
jgi:hypothetical protein